VKQQHVYIFSAAGFVFGIFLVIIAKGVREVSALGMVAGAMKAVGTLLILAAVLVAAIFAYRNRPNVHALTSNQPVRTFDAKVFRRWRTDGANLLTSEETDVEDPRYWIVLVTASGERIEVESPQSVYDECIEQSWGEASVRGSWLGSFKRSGELYRKHES
jgi:hypothetical protein